MMIDIPLIFFYIFSAFVLGSAFIVAFSNNLLRSAFALFFVLFGIAGFYVLLGGDFIGVIQIMVYAGGINVLLIFGTMLTTDISKPEISNPSFQGLFTMIIGISFLTLILVIFQKTNWPLQELPVREPTTKELGRLLLKEYVFPFEVISFLLVAAMIGAIVLVMKGDRVEEGNNES